MKVKIFAEFSQFTGEIALAEKINIWLAERTPSFKIIKILQSQSKERIAISIFYEER